MSFALLAFLFFGCASSEDAQPSYLFNPVIAPENENQLLDVSYGDDPEQKMDLYLPANRSKETTKVFVLIHGGGWYSGDKSDFNYQVIMLRSALPEYAIANINYRLGTKESLGFPKQINDVQRAVAFLNTKSKEYNVSKEYAMIGLSAGGQLAMLYSYKYNTNQQVKAVCSIVGPTDFSDPEYAGNSLFTKGLNYLVGEYPSYEQNPTIYNTVSPAKQVTQRAPKTLLFYGDSDPLVPHTQGGILHQKLDEQHVYNEYYQYEAGHANFTPEQYTDINARTTNFFRTNF